MQTKSSARSLALVGGMAMTVIALAGFAASPVSAGMLAPRSQCGGTDAGASASEQKDAMRCLINYARANAGVGGLDPSKALERASGTKAGDVMQCGFSHNACGRAADLYADRYGYTSGSSWRWGENLAWGEGAEGTPRQIVDAWLHSPPHRETMLTGAYDDLGLGLEEGNFSGTSAATVWVLQVGCRGC